MAFITDLADPRPPTDGEVYTPATRAAWRRWLAAHTDRRAGLWVRELS